MQGGMQGRPNGQICRTQDTRKRSMAHGGARSPQRTFTRHEWRIIQRLRTPLQVQRYLNALPYNQESHGQTLRSFRGVVRHGSAHCMEAALAAAVILEQHRYPPLLLSVESADYLDHVMFVYRWRGKWGSVARSRDPGLHGRTPSFPTARELALSYVEPYVDWTGRITAYAVVDLRMLGGYDWRLSTRNVWKTERLLQDYTHRPICSSDKRIARFRRRFLTFVNDHPNQKPLYFTGQDRWTELPRQFR